MRLGRAAATREAARKLLKPELGATLAAFRQELLPLRLSSTMTNMPVVAKRARIGTHATPVV